MGAMKRPAAAGRKNGQAAQAGTETQGKTELRQAIIEAADQIVRQHGTKMLTQPQVAKLVGIRQSHLTYYFPRRFDLVCAVLDRFVARSAAPAPAGRSVKHTLQALVEIFTEPNRMRFWLAMVNEAELEPEIREKLRSHMDDAATSIARRLGVPARDARVETLLALLRGYGLRRLVTGEPVSAGEMQALVAMFPAS